MTKKKSQSNIEYVSMDEETIRQIERVVAIMHKDDKKKRPEGRIKIILKEIEFIWKRNPDLRLMQLLLNAIGTFKPNTDDVKDHYNIEDDVVLQKLKDHYNE